MTHPTDRRSFLTAATAAAFALPHIAKAQPVIEPPERELRRPDRAENGPVAISSWNGLETVRIARRMLIAGADPLDAAVEGVRIVEDDPSDMTVGLGGFPNEEGVVELDSSVMHGPMHRAGSVASLRNIKNPAAVAREVARRTDHVMLVGEGALKFARRMGFKEENLLTDEARKAWLKWRSTLSREDDWLQEDEFDLPTKTDDRGASAVQPAASPRRRAAADPAREDIEWIDGVPHTWGTIHCSALTGDGNLAGVTTTSGLSWKLPGRVGDSPIIGAGLYTDNDIGSAGATGRGEAVIQICGAHTVVMRMGAGDHPTDACLYALQKIADRTRTRRLLDGHGRPNFNVVFYAVRKDGQFGSACMLKGRRYAISDAKGARLEACAALFDD